MDDQFYYPDQGLIYNCELLVFSVCIITYLDWIKFIEWYTYMCMRIQSGA